MATKRCTGWILLAGLGLSLVSGCQTYVAEAGLTLPTPFYLRHNPQYFPPSDPFPLQKELRSLEEAQKKVIDEQRP